jgi:AcrR family transcriptional regulator
MIRAMTAEAAAPTPRADVWSAHRAGIRERIVDAYMELLETASPTGASMPAVAERAGVSVRTLYRYFPSKDDLQRVAAGWFERRTRAAMDSPTIDLTNFRQYLQLLWTDVAEITPAVRVQHSTPEGRAVRAARLADSRAQVDRTLSDAITGPRRADIVDLIVAASSSSMFLELVDRMGHEPTQAADLIADLIELVVRHETGRAAGEQEGAS